MLSGINLTLKIGKEIPNPAPANLINALQTIEIINRDDGPDGFTLTFSIGRSGTSDVNRYPLLKDPLIKPFNRVIVIVTLVSKSYVLIDGAITFIEFIPSPEPGRSTLKVIGEDIGVLMDRKEISKPYYQQSDSDIARDILESYQYLGLQTVVSNDSVNMNQPPMDDIVPFQQGTDRKFLVDLAKKYDFVFYIEPNNKQGNTKAYWGPLNLSSQYMQIPLSFNMGPYTNVIKPLVFQHSALMPTLIKGSIQDRQTNQIMNIDTKEGTVKSLAKRESWEGDRFLKYAKVKQFRNKGGWTIDESITNAQAETNKSMYSVTASGELETLRYGDILRARRLINIRGVGLDFDGTYYIKNVRHTIKRGNYNQNFEIEREGMGYKK